MSVHFLRIAAMLAAALAVVLCAATREAAAEAVVFRDYSFVGRWGETDPGATHPMQQGWVRMQPRALTKVRLDNAIAAEMKVEYWGGHLGTSEQKFRANGNDWIYLPQPEGTLINSQILKAINPVTHTHPLSAVSHPPHAISPPLSALRCLYGPPGSVNAGQLGQVVEMGVAGIQGQVVLHHEGGYPQIVAGNGSALLAELAVEPGKMMRRVVIGEEWLCACLQEPPRRPRREPTSRRGHRNRD